MERKNNVRGQKLKLLALFCLITFLSEPSQAKRSQTLSTQITNTDTNNDGRNDGNTVTTGQDYENKINYSIKVTSANIRGSLKDGNCIAGTGAACATAPYFLAGQVDDQFNILKQTIADGNANAASQGFKLSDGTPLPGVENLCSSVPGAFGCMKGDYTLLKSARESMAYSISKGDPLLPPGKDAQSFLAKIDKFISDINEVQTAVLRGFSGAMNIIALNPLAPDQKDQNRSPLYSYDDYARGNQEGSWKATFGKKDWVGPQTLADMSAQVDFVNGLDVVDRQTGRSLTLWQRATRRYQAFDLSRAITLARTEGARRQAISTRAPASMKK